MSDLDGTRKCSTCKCQKPATDFTHPKTCDRCAAKNKVKKRIEGRGSKRPKGRATEGPPGTRRCSQKKWCPSDDFEPGNSTCNSCLYTEQERKATRRNSTADQLVVGGSFPIPASDADAGHQTVAESDAEEPPESQVEQAPVPPAESPVAPLGLHYTPPGTEPVSDDVDASVDDLASTLANLDFHSLVGQLYATDGSGNENNTMPAAEVSS